MSENVVNFVPKDKDNAQSSINDLLSTVTKLSSEKKISTILTIAYLEGDDEPVCYFAGKYISLKEMLGDLRLLEQVLLDEF
jgi:hypothetical protein